MTEKRSAAWRIGLILFCVLVAEWIFPFYVNHPPAWLFNVPIALVLVIGLLTHRKLHESAAELGFRLDNFLLAARLLMPPMFLILLVLVLVDSVTGSVRSPAPAGKMQGLGGTFWLVWWGFLQQYALQAIVNRQAQILWGKGARSIFPVAFIFASLHLPNPVLVLATFFAGWLWATVYQRAPNLFALALSHCLLSMALIWALPADVLHGMKVGYGYYEVKKTSQLSLDPPMTTSTAILMPSHARTARRAAGGWREG